jgi:ureidoglycolate hydrolase
MTVTAADDYTLVVMATDAAGNVSSETRTFTIDKTAPVIAMTGATDNSIVNTNVTPVFSATDTHLNAVTATLNGQPFTSGTAVTAEDAYTLVVTATDNCGNSASQIVRFTIDRTPPVIVITNVPEGCVNGDVTPVFSATDLHLDAVTATLNGQPFTSGTAVTAEDAYTLVVTATDAAGKESSQTRPFTIDKTAPAIAITGAIDGTIVNTNVTPVFSAADTHLNAVTATLNGQPFTSGAVVSAEGDFTLVVTATDNCGNSSSQTARFSIDKTPPAITTAGVPGGCVNVEVTPVFTAADLHLDTVTATLNGQPFTSGTAVTTEGVYTLQVQAGDRAGNASSEIRTFTIDRTVPVIAISGAADNAIVNTNVTPVFSATDAHLSAVTATLNGQPFASGMIVSAEGDYTLVVTATDNCGNSSSQTVRFTIDKTPPVITITGVPNGRCVNVDVTPVFSVTDLHLNGVAAMLNNAPFTSGTIVSSEGDYTLRVQATDRAGNSSSETRTFTIDKTAPVISLAGVADGSIVNTNVTPVFSAADAHLNAVSATLNGVSFTSGTVVSAEGDYTLVVTATDRCGNSSSRTLRFTIDKTPPAIAVTGVPAGCVNVNVTPQIQVTDLHPATVTVSLNGVPFTSGTAVTVEGSYTLQVTATDAAGNTAAASRTWTIDKTPPVITITGVSEGELRNEVVTPVFSATDLHLSAVAATLNGQPFTSGTLVSTLSSFTLVVTATDACGNSSSRTVHFTVGACELYPIALSAATVQGAQPGSTLPDVFNGSQSGNFGWLTWTGVNSTPSLIDSLTPPGNSSAYTNPNNTGDHTVSIGDWVQGLPGVSNSSGVSNELDTLKTIDIVVPVWDTATGSGTNSLYHIVGFARIRILDYQLPSENRITARFLGLVKCAGLVPVTE